MPRKLTGSQITKKLQMFSSSKQYDHIECILDENEQNLNLSALDLIHILKKEKFIIDSISGYALAGTLYLDGIELTNKIRSLAYKREYSELVIIFQQYSIDSKTFISIVRERKKISKKEKNIEDDIVPDKKYVYFYKPIPENIFDSNGYISPKGEYFKCHYQGHRYLAEKLIDCNYETKNENMYEKDWLDRKGWLILTDNSFLFDIESMKLHNDNKLPVQKKLTQKQINVIMDWYNEIKPKYIEFNCRKFESLKELFESKNLSEFFS